MSANVDIDKVVQLALSHVGRVELTGRNDGPYVESVVRERVPAGRVGPAWCAAWVMSVYEWAGYPIARLGPTGNPRLLPFWACRNVAELHRELRARGCIVGAGDNVQPGDLCIQLGVHTPNAVTSGHVDIVTAVDRTRRPPIVAVVGGNVSNAVRTNTRPMWSPIVTAYARPARLLEAA